VPTEFKRHRRDQRVLAAACNSGAGDGFHKVWSVQLAGS
jgi:hypothetical protein